VTTCESDMSVVLSPASEQARKDPWYCLKRQELGITVERGWSLGILKVGRNCGQVQLAPA
jgi:hypothetical protein